MNQNKIVFLYSQSPRSGHNFVADVLRILIDCYTPIGDRSEIPFSAILNAYNKAIDHFYKSSGGEAYLDNLFLHDLRLKILDTQSNCLLKYTSFYGADEALKLFPNDFHIISLRDPKDCLVSLFKGMDLKKGMKSKVKRFLLPFGIYHFTYARTYNKKVTASLPKSDNFFVIKYEDLVFKDEKALKQLIRFFDTKITVNELIDKMDAIKVINSSFFKEETKSNDMWQASDRTIDFNPVNRQKGFNKLQILGIKLGSASLRRKMGYIK